MSNITKDSNHDQLSLTLHKNLKEQLSAMPKYNRSLKGCRLHINKRPYMCTYFNNIQTTKTEVQKYILTIPGNEDGSDSPCAGTWPPELTISKFRTGLGRWL